MNVAIYGYGNLGKGVEIAVNNAPDMTLFGVFSRRDPKTVKTYGAKVYHVDSLLEYKEQIDVLILCGGSATDLPTMTPNLAKDFLVVDSFDTHAKIPEHFENVNKAALSNNKTAFISCGWDPGLFSMIRVLSNAVLPNGKDYTFWGKGISQGHSDAIRRIDGVLDARQYTVPIESALKEVQEGKNPTLTTRQKHLRECFVVAKEGADLNRIENEIKTMPNYFADYDTIVNFVSQEELLKNHSKLPHGGKVIRSGNTTEENKHVIEFGLKLDSNPEFTASVLTACARALYKMNARKEYGAKTMFDLSLKDLVDIPYSTLISTML